MVSFHLNQSSLTTQADPNGDVLHFLRSDGSDTSVRFGCGGGQCGACTVLIDGQAQNACTTPLWACEGRRVQTAQGLVDDTIGQTVLAAFIEEQAAQCGYCISGILMRITALLKHNPDADESVIKEQLSRHLCRCGAHARILRAVQRSQQKLRSAHVIP
jgi:nicotinate dehydrogenase subunit A